MSKKEKKVSISSLDKIIKEHFPVCSTIDWFGTEINIKHNLTLDDMLLFVDDTVESCFQQENGFMPEVMGFAIRSNIVRRYTNISLPDNLNHRYEILYNTNIIAVIHDNINTEQLREVIKSIEHKIAHLCDTNVVEVRNQTAKLLSAFEQIQEKTHDIFENISSEDISKISDALQNGAFSEEKLVNAYVNTVKANKNE